MSSRDKIIDGYRGVAVLFVVLGHAVAYRFALDVPNDSIRNLINDPTVAGWAGALIQRLAGPLAELGVRLFFVISGYIITTLLLAEEARNGRISISAFYVRRSFRILPPLLFYLGTVAALRWRDSLSFPDESLIASILFTCNTTLVDCNWWFAHTWSLAVEEQFYLLWPLILVASPSSKRTPILCGVLVALIGAFYIMPFSWHSNFVSFSCIAIGALYAQSARLRELIKRALSRKLFYLTLAFAVLYPLVGFAVMRMVDGLTPFLVVYLLFGVRSAPLACRLLRSAPLQIVGLGSYSLYLWQQLFLARPELYHDGPPNIALLIVAVVISVFFVERPFQRIGRRFSSTLTEKDRIHSHLGA